MKRSIILLAALTLAALLPAVAQTQLEQIDERIQRVFKRIADDPKCIVKSSMQVETATDGLRKKSLCEINEFTILKALKKHKFAAKGRDYAIDIETALREAASSPLCYRLATSSLKKGAQPRLWNIYYGDGANDFIEIGKQKGAHYTFICLSDPAAEGFRWCYAVEWDYAGVDLICGRLMKIYSKIPTQQNTQSSATQYKATLKPLAANKLLEIEGPDVFVDMDSIFAQAFSAPDDATSLHFDGKSNRFAIASPDILTDTVLLSKLKARLQAQKDLQLKNEASKHGELLQEISLLRRQYLETGDPLTAIAIYNACKHFGHLFTEDERALISRQLLDIARGNKGEADDEAKAYFRLAVKVLSEEAETADE